MKYLIGISLLMSLSCSNSGAQYKIVSAVGPCNSDQYCRVIYTDGTNEIIKMPVVGMKVQQY